MKTFPHSEGHILNKQTRHHLNAKLNTCIWLDYIKVSCDKQGY